MSSMNALTVGTLFHAGRAAWFSSGFKPIDEAAVFEEVERTPGGASSAGWHSIADAFLCEQSWVFKELRRVRKLVNNRPGPVSTADKEAAHVLLSDYFAHWNRQPKPTVKAVEHTFKADLFKATGRLGVFGKRTARLDDLSIYPEAGNRLAIGEAKTTSEPISKVVTEYGPTHGQILMQACVLKGDPYAQRFGPISGVVLDVVRKLYNKSGGGIRGAECARHFTPHYPHAVSWFGENLRLLASRLATIEEKGSGLRNHTACQRPRRSEFGTNFYECEYAAACAHGRTAASEYIYIDKAGKAHSLTSAPPWMLS